MGLSAPRNIYGVHSVAPYKRSDRTYYGVMKVLESSSLSLSGKQNDLYGGSNKYAFASETGEINSEMSLKVAQMEDFMFYLFLGKLPTATTSETSGNVTALVNVLGTSVMSATTGVASIAVLSASKANLKFGKYTVVAKTTTAVDIYISSDVDFGRGTADSYATDTLKSTAGSALTIVSATGTDVAALGLTLTGGSGTIGMTIGDTATFEVRPVNSKSSVVRIGAAADFFPEFGCIVVANKRGSDELFELDVFRCKGSGMPIGFDMFAWSKADIKAKVLYDSAKDGIFDARAVAV